MKAAPSRRDRLRSKLADLKIPGSLEALDEILQAVDGGSLTQIESHLESFWAHARDTQTAELH